MLMHVIPSNKKNYYIGSMVNPFSSPNYYEDEETCKIVDEFLEKVK
jgi:hypothetical protein